MSETFLRGTVVLDLTRVLAGPMCAQYLGDLGAEVIKVESTGFGDETRGWPPFRDDGSAIFANFNRNKRSIAVDMKTETGREIVHRLAARANIVLENFGHGVAGRLGVDEATLRAINPGLIYCSISGFGEGGTLDTLPAYDVVLQAFTGMMELTGEIGSGPIRSPYSPVDYITGLHAAIGILAALGAQRQGGQGTRIDVSLFDTAMGLLSYQIESYWASGKLPSKNGSSHPSMCPYQALEAADGPFLLAISNDGQWRRFCIAAGVPELAEDPRFTTNSQRVANRPATLSLVQDLLRTRSGEDWLVLLGKHRVPCSPIRTLAEVLRHPHTMGRDVIGEYSLRNGDIRKAVNVPVRFDRRDRTAGSAPPEMSEHARELLEQVGYDETEVARLIDAGIVGVPS